MKKLYCITIVMTVLTSPSAIYARVLSPQERLAVENAVKDQLVDPKSATFKHPQVDFPVGIVGAVYCGHVNSKNRMGGYNGDVQFIASFIRTKVKPVTYEGTLIGIGDADPESSASQAVSTQCLEDAPKILVNSVVK